METVDTITIAGDSLRIAREHVEQMAQRLASYTEGSPDMWSMENFHADDLLSLGEIASYSCAIGVGFVALLFLIWLGVKRLPSCVRDVSLKGGFIFFWLYGFVVYDVGMCTGDKISLLTNAPMALVHAFMIFLFDSDISEIHDAFHEDWFYSLNFALVHFGASVITTLFLIKHFGFNVIAKFRMIWAAAGPWKRSVDDTYVFWGMNEQTYLLIESLKEKLRGSESAYRVVIVRTRQKDADPDDDKVGIDRIFGFLAMPSADLERMEALGCLTTATYNSLENTDTDAGKIDVFGKVLRLKALRWLIKHRTGKNVFMFFLSDDEKSNLHDVSVMLRDTTINEFLMSMSPSEANPSSDNRKRGDDKSGEKERHVKIYCHARYNSVHRVIEDRIKAPRLEVKVVDSSHINVELLKEREELLPVSYVDVNADATVSSAFNALVIGFSEVGLDSVRFLYEFGAFVKSGSPADDAVRSDFHLDVVDRNMRNLAGPFVANAPAIMPSMPFIDGGLNPDSLITLHDMDCNSVEFYMNLEKWIKTLNYIVVATDNDELNVTLGVRIFKEAARYRKDMRNFCILVRAHDDDDCNIGNIADHYNHLWKAYESCVESGSDNLIRQRRVRRDDAVAGPIHIFGKDKDVYTYDNIIGDALEAKAREYKERYDKCTHADSDGWDKEYCDKMMLGAQDIDFSPTYYGMMNLRRSRSQNFINCLHEITKKVLFRKAVASCLGLPYKGQGETAELDRVVAGYVARLSRQIETLRYDWSGEPEPEIDRILLVMAQTEHLRWNASHEILGYVPGEKNEVRLSHDCLKDWSRLRDDLTRSYDFNVVDITLGIKINPKNDLKD